MVCYVFGVWIGGEGGKGEHGKVDGVTIHEHIHTWVGAWHGVYETPVLSGYTCHHSYRQPSPGGVQPHGTHHPPLTVVRQWNSVLYVCVGEVAMRRDRL